MMLTLSNRCSGLIYALVIASAVFSCGETSVTVEKVNQAIIKEIPLGSSKSQVLNFLDNYSFGSKKFKYIGFRDDPETLEHLFQYDNFDDKPLKLKDKLKGIISAGIYEIDNNPVTTSSILIRFYFDHSERLIDYTVKKQVDE